RLVGPPRFLAARHPTNAAYSVDNSSIMASSQSHFEEFGMFFARGFIPYFMIIAYGNSIRRIPGYYFVILYINGRNPVGGCRKNKGIVEAHFIGTRRYLPIPVRSSVGSQP